MKEIHVRGFEVVKGYEQKEIHLPIRSTLYSAGYDIEAAENVKIPPFQPANKPTLIPTGLKAYFPKDEYMMLVNRSSGPKKGLVLANGIGIVDADYYQNEENDGHFYFQYYNISDHEIEIKKGEKIGQAIFQKFLLMDQDNAFNIRKGGLGSTDKI